MNSNYHIHYLQQHEIDKTKWDNCITDSGNGLIYAYSHYLDCMARNWDALVLDDYKIVMPLTWSKKYGIHYLYQPAFAASLGVFGNDLNEELIAGFIDAIPKKFRLVEIALNQKNLFSHKAFSIRNNYILHLNKTYENLHKDFKENIKRNIKKAQQLECAIRKDIPVADVIALSKLSSTKIDECKNRRL